MKTKIKKSALALAVTFAATAGAADAVEVLYDLPVLPTGPQTQPVDGRPMLSHENVAIAASFNAKSRKVPLDVGHLTEFDGAAPAMGWVRELYVADDGSLWARCLMTAEGQALIDGRQFGYTSPTLRIIETEMGWTAMSLKSLALTNNPALEMSATFTAEDTEDDESEEDAPDTTPPAAETQAVEADTPAAVDAPAPAEQTPADAPTEAAEVQAPATAETPADDAAATFAALQGTTATLMAERDAARTEAITLSAQLATLTSQVSTLTAEVAAFSARATTAETALAQVQADQAERAVVAAVDGALAAGHFTVTLRETLLKQARNDLAGFTSMVASMRPNPAFTFSLATQRTEVETFGLTHEQLQHCKRVGISAESYAASLQELN